MARPEGPPDFAVLGIRSISHCATLQYVIGMRSLTSRLLITWRREERSGNAVGGDVSLAL